MKKSFKLIGLDCANCAAKIEHAIRGLPDVVSISINFMTAKMFIEADPEKMDNLLIEVKKIINKIEPDVKVEKA